MLPTFVIGLREGVEAALIVGIIAGFLRQEGRRDALRPMWLGVGAAVAICVAVGIALELLDQELPQRQQEGARDRRRHRGGRDRHVHDRLDAPPRARPLRPAARGAPARRWRPARPARWWRWRSSPSSARGSRPSSSCSPCSRTPRTPRARAPARCSASPRAVAIGLLDLPRRHHAQPGALLPHHRRRARARRGRAGGQRDAHRARGGLAQRRPGAGARPQLARRPGHVDVGAADRDARLAAAADGRPR